MTKKWGGGGGGGGGGGSCDAVCQKVLATLRTKVPSDIPSTSIQLTRSTKKKTLECSKCLLLVLSYCYLAVNKEAIKIGVKVAWNDICD